MATFHCQYCSKSFEPIYPEMPEQSNRCASGVYIQQHSDKYKWYSDMIDCDPDTTQIPFGHKYIQSYYGSKHDGDIIKINDQNKNWKEGRICDECIDKFLNTNDFVCITDTF